MRANPLIRIPRHIVLLGRTLGLLSGLARSLDAGVDPLQIVFPYVVGPPPPRPSLMASARSASASRSAVPATLPRGGRRSTLAAWADQHGFDSIWLPEGHLRPGATASPLVALAALAARTRARLGTTSLLISIHDPLRVAAEVATLDQLSGGRVILGVGRGFEPAMFDAFGIDPRNKRDRFDEALDAILARWRDATRRAPAASGPHPIRDLGRGLRPEGTRAGRAARTPLPRVADRELRRAREELRRPRRAAAGRGRTRARCPSP